MKMALTRIGKEKIRQLTPIAEGGEGYIYEFDNDILKIYKPCVDIAAKEKKVAMLIDKPLPKEAIKPITTVYDNNNKFIGYIMPKAVGEEVRVLTSKKYLKANGITTKHIFRKRLFSACHPLHSDTDIQWIAQRPSSPQFDRPYHYPSKAWSFGTLITGRVLRHFPPECRRQLPQSGLRSENVRFRNGPRRIPMVLVGFTKCCMLHSVQHLRIHRTTLIQQRTDFATWRHDNR